MPTLVYHSVNVFKFENFGEAKKRVIKIWSAASMDRVKVTEILYAALDDMKAHEINFMHIPAQDLVKTIVLESDNFEGVEVIDDGKEGSSVLKMD